MIILLWMLSGLFFFVWRNDKNPLWETNPGFMIWGLILSVLGGPLFIIGYVLSRL